ncbi:MAG: hypothetical protein WDM86_17085 [Rhizomicrobium sp.]
MARAIETLPSMVLANGRSVAENLEQAAESGALVRREDGRFELADFVSHPGKPSRLDPFIKDGPQGAFPPCAFLNHFLFRQAYGESAVPFGCRDCYKVKVVSRSMRQLMAVRDIVKSLPCASKSGPEVDNPQNSSPYGTYLYLTGLGVAQAYYRKVREKIDQHSSLGPDTKMLVKRGCSNYEHRCGPSDKYTFDPRLEPLEAALATWFVAPVLRFTREIRNALALTQMVRTAYRIGDETYKDFNGGRDLVQPTVNYAPGPEVE